jgi:hypothetical protein
LVVVDGHLEAIKRVFYIYISRRRSKRWRREFSIHDHRKAAFLATTDGRPVYEEEEEKFTSPFCVAFPSRPHHQNTRGQDETTEFGAFFTIGLVVTLDGGRPVPSIPRRRQQQNNNNKKKKKMRRVFKTLTK